MINFNFYKQNGQWRLIISEENTTLTTVTFEKEISREDILSLIPILSKGDITNLNVNFTDVKE